MMECRGTGASEHTVDGYSLQQYALDVIGLMDNLSIDRLTMRAIPWEVVSGLH